MPHDLNRKGKKAEIVLKLVRHVHQHTAPETAVVRIYVKPNTALSTAPKPHQSAQRLRHRCVGETPSSPNTQPKQTMPHLPVPTREPSNAKRNNSAPVSPRDTKRTQQKPSQLHSKLTHSISGFTQLAIHCPLSAKIMGALTVDIVKKEKIKGNPSIC